MTIAAIIQGVIGAAGAVQKGIASAKQKKMAKEYGKTERPDYQIPPSLQKATDMARANLNPEINKQLLQEIAANSATAINRAGKVGSSTADMLAAIGGINANENAAKRQFFGDNQQRKDAMLGQYMNALQGMAGQENKAWEWNKAQPYLNAQDAAQALNQSSAQNAAGALGDLAAGLGGSAKSLMMGKQMDIQGDQMKQMMELLGYGDKTKKAGLGGGGIESLGQKGLPALSEIVKPDTDPNAPYKPNAADLLGFSKDGLLPKPKLPSIAENPIKDDMPEMPMDNSLTNGLTEVPIYQIWKSKLPENLQNEKDYDLQQLYRDNPTIQPTGNLHFPSKYKKPNHITFSDESIYSTPKTQGGVWDVVDGKDRFTPSAYNLSQYTPEQLQAYFKREEPNSILNLPTTPIQNTNIPAAQRIAEKPTAPLVFTNTTGQVIENGKPINRSGVFGQPRPKVGESLSRQISPALDMILKLMNK